MGAKITLNDALRLLNPEDDYNWTEDGLPRMDVIEKLMVDRSVSRKDVTDADPEFCREVQAARVAEAKQAEAAVEAAADADAAGTEVDDSPDLEPEVDVNEDSNERDKDGLQGHQTQTQTKGQVDPEEELRDEIVAVGQQIEELSTERAEVDKMIDQLKKYQAKLQVKTQKQHSSTADMKARMAFIYSQNEQRAKRYEKGRKIIAAIGKDGLNPSSRLDQAMRRKTARGTRRPPPRQPGQ